MIKPLNDYVLLEKLEAEKKVGAIILTSEKKKANAATVVAVGPGAKDKDGKLVPVSLKVGETVIFREYSGTDYEDGDKKYLLIKEEDILAVIE